MRIFIEEYGGFMVELISGAAALGVLIGIWPLIREFMSGVVYLLI